MQNRPKLHCAIFHCGLSKLLQLLHITEKLCSVTARRHKYVSSRLISFRYQSWRRDNVSAWSATSRSIWDLNEMSLRRRMLRGVFQNIISAIVTFRNWREYRYSEETFAYDCKTFFSKDWFIIAGLGVLFLIRADSQESVSKMIIGWKKCVFICLTYGEKLWLLTS